MIRYTLSCDHDHVFEGWFSSGADYDRQAGLGLVTCPVCGSSSVAKQLMVPSVATGRKKEEARMVIIEQAQKQAVAKIREMVATIRENAEDVGEKFPEEARKIHYGEADARGLIGKATPQEARDLIEEGIEIAALPILPDDIN
ncbi:DUF1178 family protein [Pararhizobium antarcticum]|uniref:Uncharacterized protein n=1 Tax=Pararhizobium antarcticum TaxID=1798805 RepID=A0A657LL04_9HYPH|nr:DUF1178 family protein [Pararhizobium antarcticum]OJF90796.1 hypothetical protein AX760_23880 [Pararhizobium antarcticum]OJG01305.1 hypothetical protein AX761_01460 [Rhizobium sp. 58]